MSAPRSANRFTALLSRFRRDKKANIAVIFAIACIPVMTSVGCAIDYTFATRMKAKMQSSADAAAVASISQKSLGYNAAVLMSGNGSVPAGVTDANNIFNGNLSTVTGYTNLNLTSTVTKTGVKLASDVRFTADVPVTFMSIIGFTAMTISGEFEGDRFAAAISGFLPGTGCFGVDGLAVDRRRADAARRNQPG